jgi:hypothetical protein
MSEAYRKVKKEPEVLPENEIRIMYNARVGKYIKRAHDLVSGNIEGQNSVVIKGMAKAMDNVIRLAELLKHTVKGLY